jgi:hypothetical protein
MAQGQEGTSRGAAATLEAFRATRPLALAISLILFAYAVSGGAAGVVWLISLAQALVAGPPPAKPFITAWSVNLLFVPVALTGGLRALGYFSAAGHACERHDPADLERASVAMRRLLRWAGGALAVLVAFLACMAVAAVLTGEFPG